MLPPENEDNDLNDLMAERLEEYDYSERYSDLELEEVDDTSHDSVDEDAEFEKLREMASAVETSDEHTDGSPDDSADDMGDNYRSAATD